MKQPSPLHLAVRRRRLHARLPAGRRRAAQDRARSACCIPVTGALAYSGQQCREGALMAIDDINKAGGIKSHGRREDRGRCWATRSRTPQAGAAEVEKMNEAGVSAVRRRLSPRRSAWPPRRRPPSTTCRTSWTSAWPTRSCERGLKNTFRFGPGYRKCAEIAMANLHVLNTAAGKPAKTVMIIHEESLFGTGTANLLARELPGYGFEVKEVVKHANPTRDFNNIVLRMKALNPDIVIPANYYNEYALLVRTMQQQKVTPKAIYSVLGGAASSYKFVKEFPDAANGIIDCNHWFNPKDKRSAELRKRVEAKGLFFTLRDLQHLHGDDAAGRRHRARQVAPTAPPSPMRSRSSTFSDHFMPYGPTKFVNGQNTGAQPLMTQVLKNDIKVIVPREYREVDPVFPLQGLMRAARSRPCSTSASCFRPS